MLIAFFAGCKKKAVVIPDNAVVLEGLYATSVKLDYEEYGPHKLFDGGSDYWTTMPGAGPDEGVMLYFSGKTKIKSMTIEPALNPVKKVQIYTNGIDMGTYSVGKPININMDILKFNVI